jgi:membrane-associated phospholipid phosphatase
LYIARLIITTIVAIVAAQACRADSPYQLEKSREWFLVGGGAVLGVSAIIVLDSVDPLTEEQIASLNPDDVNSFDRNSIAPYRDTASGDGLLIASYMLPATFLVYPVTRKDWQTLGVMWAEVTLLNLGLNGVVKGLTTRTRPYAYDAETPMEKKTEVDARFSFYSGHTSSAAANCFFVAKVFNDYLDDKRARAAIWAGAAIYPALTGYLRRDSGHHFRTDVIAGYCLGAIIGYCVPKLHESDGSSRISISTAPVMGGAGVGLRVDI